jgi:hypothetical protein
MGQAADFFVSYTSPDRAWAEWIAWQLEAEGYQVVVQAWDFTPGRDWVHEMQQATATAARVVVLLSPPTSSRATAKRNGGSFMPTTLAASRGGCCRFGSGRWRRRAC